MNNKSLFLVLVLSGILLLPWENAFAQKQTDEKLGMMYYNNKEWDKALEVFQRLFDNSPNQFNYIYLTNILIETKDYTQAEKVVKKQMKANNDDPRYQVDMGYLQILQGDVNKGRKIYDNCLKNLPANKNQIYNLTNAFNLRLETDYAMRTYLQGRVLLKEPTAFAFELGYIYEVQGNIEKMCDEYLNLIKDNPQQMNMVQNRIQAWLSDDPDNSKNDTYRSILLKKTQQFPDEKIYTELLLWHSIQQKDFQFAFIQAKALDRRFNEDGKRIFELATLCVSNEQFEPAIEAYNYLIKKNANTDITMNSRIGLANTELKQYESSYSTDNKRLLKIENDYIALLNEYGKNSRTIPLILNLARVQAFYLQKNEEAIALLNETIGVPGLQNTDLANCKLQLADIYLYSGEQWEATLLYSQVEKAFKNEPLGHEAKFKNAKLSFYIGEFEWAKAQLNILKAATSKLIANDALDLSLTITENVEEDSNYIPLSMYAKAELLQYQGKTKESLAMLDSIQNSYQGHSIIDEVLFKKAEIYKNEGKFELAITFYNKIVDNYSTYLLADDALFNMALLFEKQLLQKDKAMEYFQQLITQYPGSLYVVEARKHFRTLRNDLIN